MFCLKETFAVHDESGGSYCLTETHQHRYTVPSGKIEDGRFVFSRQYGVYLINTPCLRDFRLDAEIARSREKTDAEWLFFYGYDPHTRRGNAISVTASEGSGTVSVLHLAVDRKNRSTIAWEDFPDTPIAPEEYYRFSLERKDGVCRVEFAGRSCEFQTDDTSGRLCISQAGEIGDVYFRSLSVSSDDAIETVRLLDAVYTLPCYDGGSEPYTLSVTAERLGEEITAVRYTLDGGAYTRPWRDYAMAVWSVQYDVLEKPYLRLNTKTVGKKLYLQNGRLVFSEQNSVGAFGEKFMHASAVPYSGVFYLPSGLPGEQLSVSVGCALFRRLGNEFQSGEREYVFSDSGELLYAGDDLSRPCRLRVESPADKRLTKQIPETVSEYRRALLHAAQNHYFLKGEEPQFTVYASSRNARGVSFSVSLADACLSEIGPIPFSAEPDEENFLCRFGDTAWKLKIFAGSLPQSVYHLHVVMRYGEKTVCEHDSAFEIIDPDSTASPRESAGLPMLYSGEGAPPNIRYNCPDPWIVRPDFNACHYFDCLLCQGEVAEERRVWELLPLYKLKLFSWIDDRSVPRDRTWRDFPGTVAHSDYLDVNSMTGEGFPMTLPMLFDYPGVRELYSRFLTVYPEYRDRLPDPEKGEELREDTVSRIFSVCPEEWVSFLNRNTNAAAREFQEEIRAVNPRVRFSKYGVHGYYATNHVNAYCGKWRTNDMERFHLLRDGFAIFEDYAFITGQEPYYCAWGLMGYMLHTPQLRVLPEFFSDFDPVCPDAAVYFANPPMGDTSVRAYQTATQLAEYLFASCVRNGDGFRYYRDDCFQLLQSYSVEAEDRLRSFLRMWGAAKDDRPKRPLRAPVFVCEFSPDEDIYDRELSPRAVNNRSLAGVSYLYQILSESGLPRGFAADWDGLLQIGPEDTDLVILPSLHHAPESVISHLRELSLHGVSLFAVGDVSGLEDLFGVALQKKTAVFGELFTDTETEQVLPYRDTLYYRADGAGTLLSASDDAGEAVPVLLKKGNNLLLNCYIGHIGIADSLYDMQDTANISFLLKSVCQEAASAVSSPLAVTDRECGLTLAESESGARVMLLTDFSPYGSAGGKEVSVFFHEKGRELLSDGLPTVLCGDGSESALNPITENGTLCGFSVVMKERGALLLRLGAGKRRKE